MFNISFDITYKLKLGFIVIQQHDEGTSKWRILDGNLECCFNEGSDSESKWVKADILLLDPNASYSFEPEKRNK